jgi:D-Tyr-tRNAtyr deacylase
MGKSSVRAVIQRVSRSTSVMIQNIGRGRIGKSLLVLLAIEMPDARQNCG